MCGGDAASCQIALTNCSTLFWHPTIYCQWQKYLVRVGNINSELKDDHVPDIMKQHRLLYTTANMIIRKLPYASLGTKIM